MFGHHNSAPSTIGVREAPVRFATGHTVMVTHEAAPYGRERRDAREGLALIRTVHETRQGGNEPSRRAKQTIQAISGLLDS